MICIGTSIPSEWYGRLAFLTNPVIYVDSLQWNCYNEIENVTIM